MMKILKTIVAVLLAFPMAAVASNTGAAFLKIIPMAESAGMGGAYTALSGSLNSFYYNPAGISSLEATHIGASHAEWIAGMRYNFGAAAFRLGGGVAGISATYLTTGKMEGRGPDRERTEDFAASDFAAQIGYGRDLAGRFSLGGAVKIINQNIADDSALGFAVDAGIQRDLGNDLSIGISVRNLGPQMRFINTGYNLPLTVSAGEGTQIGGVRAALDTSWGVFDENLNLSFGSQWQPFDFLALRGGYLLNLVNRVPGANGKFDDMFDSGLGGGMGLSISSYMIDYAFIPYAELGNTQRISFSGKF